LEGQWQRATAMGSMDTVDYVACRRLPSAKAEPSGAFHNGKPIERRPSRTTERVLSPCIGNGGEQLWPWPPVSAAVEGNRHARARRGDAAERRGIVALRRCNAAVLRGTVPPQRCPAP